ncbi:N-methyl-L-tryptophan oxidase [Cellulomonas sp. ACRRI]|uniref:N-methyl-L-tryptophan oxidase n=1 Tax=Cellulomonas sp. ACRRI TaxID=2918188 RepID=UPI001EF28C75|nr:N-methyl-L-tryptophan oxidase [Cellulomonas sp. ACRRI]MCG7284878.1 N-methyl-L-tryptophan oxidase [Cellulomonas sp. ACRRI]
MSTARAGAGVWDADVVVVGTGAWGSMAAWRLAEDGVDVLAVDRWEAPHAHGSSWGSTRLFRRVCLEHPLLSGLADLSLDLYRELEDPTDPLVTLSGGLTIGHPGGRAVPAVRAAAERSGLPVETLDRDALAERFPFHGDVAPDEVGVLDPSSGALRIETAVARALEAAQKAGARTRSGVHVTAVVEIPGGYRVETTTGVLRAPRVVVAAGSWTRELLPALPLRTTRMPMTWFAPRTGTGVPTDLERVGAFIREVGDGGGYWGHGALPGEGVKVGPRGAVARRDDPLPDQLDRTFHPADGRPAADVVARWLPALHPDPTAGYVCHSTRTPDEQFLVGEVGDGRGLVVAAGESGHGGKHSAGIGQLVADLVQGRAPTLDTGYLDPRRF